MLTKSHTDFIVEMSSAELAEKEQVIERGKQTFVDVGLALMEIRKRRGYRVAGYSTFEEYCQARWEWGRNYANKLIAAAEVIDNLGTTVPILPTTETQARPLAALEPEQQREVWEKVVETAPEGRITAAHVQNVVDETLKRPHVSYNAGNNEWYTPPEYVEAACAVMGKIDLDPASSEIANRTVGASTYYSAEDDGLLHEWRGRVWMNPPYASEWVGKFSEKLAQHFNEGKVTEALVLVNNATETNWFQTLLICASAVCFVRQRVRFLDPDGNPGAPLQGQAVLYLGDKVKLFSDNFEQFGQILYGRA